MRRARGERGAVLPLVGIMASLLVTVAAFAVDLGMQRVARRDMQALSDVVALDLARQLDGRTAAAILGDPVWSAAKEQSVARNNTTLGDPPTVTAQLGQVDATTGVFTEVSGSTVPTAVRVAAATKVAFAFRGGKGGVSRDAVAAVALTPQNCIGVCQMQEVNAFACWRVGSFAVRLASSESAILNELIGDALNTGVVTYDGLAQVNVSFEQLNAALGIGSPTEFATTDVTVGNLVDAVATVLTGQGTSSAAVSILNAIKANLTSAMQGAVIPLGDVVSVGVGNESAFDAQLNVLDLIAGTAFVANGTNFLSVPSLTVSIPNVTVTNLSLKVIEGPQIACGKPGQTDAKATTSQVTLTIDGKLGQSWSGGIVAVDDSTIRLTVDSATAEATLAAINCTGGAAHSIDLTVANKTLASVGLALDLRTLSLLNLPLAGVTANVATTKPGASGTYQLALPANYDTPVSTGSGVALSPLSTSDLQVSLLGILSLDTGTLLSEVVNPLVTRLNDLVVSTLAPRLGMTVAGADLFAVRTPACSRPILVGASP